ncbi:MAG: chemotaxis protein CheW [Spirulinaceae cyanobacterium]
MTSPSTQEQVLARAQAGDLTVIASLLNHKFAPEGITAQVRWLASDRLRVDLAADQTPNAAVCLPIIERGFQRLAISHLAWVDVAAYQQGEDLILWQQQVSLTPAAVAIDLAAWLESGSSLQSSVVALPSRLTPAPTVALEPEQKYLSFTLGIANPGLLAVEAIQEILYIQLRQILPVPELSAAVVGLHNWRGEMLWLVDLNHLLGLGGLDVATMTPVNVLVLRWNNRTLGLMVKSVGEILPYPPEQLQAPTGLFNPSLEPFIAGYHQESSSIVLKPAAIFNAAQCQSVH